MKLGGDTRSISLDCMEEDDIGIVKADAGARKHLLQSRFVTCAGLYGGKWKCKEFPVFFILFHFHSRSGPVRAGSAVISRCDRLSLAVTGHLSM